MNKNYQAEEVKNVDGLFDFQEQRKDEFRYFGYAPIGKHDYTITSFSEGSFWNLYKFVEQTTTDQKYMWSGNEQVWVPEQRLFNRYLGYIISEIIDQRNKLLNSQKNLSLNEPKLLRELESLEQSLDTIIKFYDADKKVYFQGYLAPAILPEIGEKAKEVKSVIVKDKKAFPKYVNDYSNAKESYEQAKYNYEQKSRFGKLMAKVNGEYKKLQEARINYGSFNAIEVRPIGDGPYLGITDPLKQFRSIDSISAKYQREIDSNEEETDITRKL